MRTDCQSLLRTAAQGLDSATLASRPLARLWGLIGGALDGHLGRLSSGGALVWLPAHRTRAAVG